MSVILVQLCGLDQLAGLRLQDQQVVTHLKSQGILKTKELKLHLERTMFCHIKM